MSILYHNPILLSKKQIKQIQSGQMVEIRRKKRVLRVALKGYNDKRAKILAEIAKLKQELVKIKR